MSHDHESRAQELSDLADAAVAAEAFHRGDLTYEQSDNTPVDLPPAEGDVMVVRSIRLPVDLEVRAKAVAEARRLPYSALIREWISDGLDRAEAGERRDPVTELHRIADAAQRALKALETHQDAA